MVHLFVNSDNFYESLKKLRLEDNFIVKSIGTTLLNRVSQPNMPMKAACFMCTTLISFFLPLLNCKFEGTEGEWFQKLTARFCSHQSWALDQIKNRQKKEPRFNSFILVPAWPWNQNGKNKKCFSKCLSNTDVCCVFLSGGREQAPVPQATTQRHHSNRNAETDQIPTAVGEHCQKHRCVCDSKPFKLVLYHQHSNLKIYIKQLFLFKFALCIVNNVSKLYRALKKYTCIHEMSSFWGF